MSDGKNGALTFAAVGDIGAVVHETADHLFELNAHVLKAADITFGQLETTYSTRGERQLGGFRWNVPYRPPLGNVPSFRRVGFDIMSFASNHSLDYGVEAFFDTIDLLKKNDIEVVGVGKDLAEARKPVFMERNGVRVAFLAYNSILPPGYDATYDRPGTNPIRVSTFYEQVDWQPGTPPRIVTMANSEDLEGMREDIRKVRSQADIVIVAQHSGVHLVPDVLCMYQKEIARAAVDCGADLVLQHHAHLLAGVEIYKGKGIFYGLGNFAQESFRGTLLETSLVKEHHEFYKLKIDPEWKNFPFPGEARKTMIVKAAITNKKITKVGFVPCLTNQKVQAEVLPKKDPRSQVVVDYVAELSRNQGFNTTFSWEGDEIVVG
ncbi:MAG: CapA family protein [Bauldia sp.]